MRKYSPAFYLVEMDTDSAPDRHALDDQAWDPDLGKMMQIRPGSRSITCQPKRLVHKQVGGEREASLCTVSTMLDIFKLRAFETT